MLSFIHGREEEGEGRNGRRGSCKVVIGVEVDVHIA